MRFLGRVLRRLLFLLALLGIATAGWVFAPTLVPQLREWVGLAENDPTPEAQPSQALADSVLGRVQEFRQTGDGQLALGSRELTSVLRYSLPGLIPTGIRELAVELDGGRIEVSAEVFLGAFPELPDLGRVLGFLPDTVDVVLKGSLMEFEEEEAALLVHGLDANRIPIPRRLISAILQGIGRADRPGLPPEALPVPLPAGLRSAYILSDSLILSFSP